MSGRLGLRRVNLIGSVAVYVATFNWTYIQLVAPRYPDWGLSPDSPPIWHFIFCCLISILPSLWLPVMPTRPSQFLFLVQYLVIFVPATFITYYSSAPRLPLREAFLLDLVMFVGLSLVQLIYFMPVVGVRTIKMSPNLLSLSLAASFVLLLGYLILAFHSVFRFANFEGIYSVRFAMSEVAARSGTRLGLYAQMWLAGFFLPLFFSLGIFARKTWLVAVAGTGYLFLFGVAGHKTAVVALVLLPVLYMWSVRSRENASAAFTLGLSALLCIGLVVDKLPFPSLTKWFIAVVNFRTFAVPQLLIVQYFDFFRDHPLTFFSHVRGVSLLLRYPYGTDLGTTIGEFFYGGSMGANAGMWAGDGLAGFGLGGILLISGVCAVVFWIIDVFAAECDTRFVIVALGFIAMTFANASLFTTILSGGLGMLVATLALMPNSGVFRLVKGRYLSPTPGGD